MEMIDSVCLKNWKTHLESKLSFSAGTNAILGNVGTGKSSVLDSICFALFGTFPALQARKLKLDDLIMRRPVEKSGAEVMVGFTTAGKKYLVKRAVEKGKGTTYSEIREGGRLLETNTSRVTEVVEKILKTNYETFSKAIYSEQNNIDYFLTLGKGQRIKKIDELLMIEKFESARSGCVSLRNKIAGEKAGMESAVSQVKIGELEADIKNVHLSIEESESRLRDFDKELKSVREEKAVLSKELNEVSSIDNVMKNMERDKAVLENVLDDVSNNIKTLENDLEGKEVIGQDYLGKIKTDISSLELALKDLRLKREKAFKTLAETASKIETLGETMSELSEMIKGKTGAKEKLEFYKKSIGEDVGKEMEEKRKLLNKSVHEVEYLRVRINDLEAAIIQLSHSESRCPVCEKKMDRKTRDRLVAMKRKEIKALSGVLVNGEEGIKTLEKHIRNLEDSWKEVQKLEIDTKDLPKLQKQMEEKKRQAGKINAENSESERILKDIDSQVSEIEAELKAKIDEKQAYDILQRKFLELMESREKTKVIGSKIKNIYYQLAEQERKLNGRRLEALEKRMKELEVKEAEDAVRRESLLEIIKERMKGVSEAENRLSMIKSIKEKAKRLESVISDLNVFEQAVMRTQEELRKQFVETVNYTMNQLWNTLYPYGDFIEIRLHVEDGDYVLKLLSKSGVWNNADGSVSGGERSIAALALRIAFALTLAPNIRMLILDEPTANLDRNSLIELATTLRERASEFMDQIIVITHEEELEEAATGNVYKLERDKFKDGVTSVVLVQ